MERLTYKNYIEEYEVNFEKSSDKNWSIAESDTHMKVTGEPIDKLGELEDVLEKYGIDNLDDLELRLEDIEHYAYQANKQLQHKLEVAERAVESAVEIANIKSNQFWTVEELKEQAEAEINKRSNNDEW